MQKLDKEPIIVIIIMIVGSLFSLKYFGSLGVSKRVIDATCVGADIPEQIRAVDVKDYCQCRRESKSKQQCVEIVQHMVESRKNIFK